MKTSTFLKLIAKEFEAKVVENTTDGFINRTAFLCNCTQDVYYTLAKKHKNNEKCYKRLQDSILGQIKNYLRLYAKDARVISAGLPYEVAAIPSSRYNFDYFLDQRNIEYRRYILRRWIAEYKMIGD